MKHLKTVVELLSLWTLLYLLDSCAYSYFYYSKFNIFIFNFVDNSEIPFLFFPQIAKIYFSLAGIFIFFLMVSADDSMNEDEVKKFLGSKRIKLKITLFWIYIIVALITLIWTGISLQGSQLLIFLSVLSLAASFYIAKFLSQFIESAIAYVAAIIYIGTIVFMFFFVKVDEENVRLGKYKKSISFLYKNKQIKTADSLFTIGDTKQYFFLYKRKDSSVQVIRKSDVDSVVYR